jgi:hypothetical protein
MVSTQQKYDKEQRKLGQQLSELNKEVSMLQEKISNLNDKRNNIEQAIWINKYNFEHGTFDLKSVVSEESKGGVKA